MKPSLSCPIAWPLLVTALFAQANDAIAQQCPFSEPFSYAGTTLLRQPGKLPYVFVVNHVKVDADGAPNAYHPADIQLHCTQGTGFKGLDCPANAGYPKKSWWRDVLVADPANPARAYTQQPPGEFTGYFVSQTALVDPTKAAIDPARYVDARNVPYLVFPENFYLMKGTGAKGDLGYAINTQTGAGSPFIVADIGPDDATLGEMSIALAKAMGGKNPNPRTGTGLPSGKILLVVFPRSAATPKWPLSKEHIDTAAGKLLTEAGGKEQLLACADRLSPK